MSEKDDGLIVGNDGLRLHMAKVIDMARVSTGGGTITASLLEDNCDHAMFFLDADGVARCAVCGKVLEDAQ